jgi:hypothetical protein
MWAIIGSHLLVLLFQRDWGVDTFGPVHAFELSLPVLILTVIAARKVTDLFAWVDANGRPSRTVFPPFVLAAFIVCAWLGFVPVRLHAARQIAAHLNTALRAPETAGLHRAVIFAPTPFAPPCRRTPNHFVNFRPVNDPDLHNDVLWVNHIDIENDRRLVKTLGDRTGYVMRWTEACAATFLPLATLKPGDVPPVGIPVD